MENTEVILVSLLLAVVVLSAAARAIHVPYPIVLVVGGTLLGLTGGLPDVELDPELVLVIFLPPLLYSAAFFANLNDLRANLRPIILASVPLVLATMVAVAVVAHTLIPDISWPVAFTLGAIVGPTDPVAGTQIARRMGVPRRLVSILEGESLINDATALVAYRIAAKAATSAVAFSLLEAGWEFLWKATGGIALGLLVGWLIAEIRKRLNDPLLENTIGLLSPPEGAVLYIICTIFKCTMWQFVKEGWLMLSSIVVVVIAVIFWPDLVLWLPNLIFGKE